MPRIPNYSGRRVAPAVISGGNPTPYIPKRSPVAVAANALKNVSQGLREYSQRTEREREIAAREREIAAREQMRLDKTKATQAFNNYAIKEQEIYSKVLSLRGVNAEGSAETYMDETAYLSEGAGGELTSKQKELYNLQISEYTPSRLKRIYANTETQTFAASQEASAAMVTTQQRVIMDSGGDMDTITSAVSAIKVHMMDDLLEGQDTAVKTVKALEAVSDAVTGMLYNVLASDPKRALLLYKELEGAISPDKEAQVLANIQQKVSVFEVQESADSIIDGTEDGDIKNQRKLARELFTGEQRSALINELNTRHTEYTQQKNAKEKDFIRNATSQIVKAGGLLNAENYINTLPEDKGYLKAQLSGMARTLYAAAETEAFENETLEKFLDAKTVKAKRAIAEGLPASHARFRLTLTNFVKSTEKEARAKIKQAKKQERDKTYLDIFSRLENGEALSNEEIRFAAGGSLSTGDIINLTNLSKNKAKERERAAKNARNVSWGTIKTIYKDLTGEESVPADILLILADSLPSRLPEGFTDSDIGKAMGALISEGELYHGSLLSLDWLDWLDSTYAEAKANGEEARWLPHIKDDRERDNIIAELKILRGKNAFTGDPEDDEYIKAYKRYFILNIPLPDRYRGVFK